MGLRELKETAHAQYLRGRFEQCAQTYRQILRLAPKDPNVRVRHAEACRRAGDRQQAIASYRMAADLLLAVGCDSRARGALKAALELDPKDPVLLADLSRLGPSGPFALEEERAHGSPIVPGVLEPWTPPAPRSMTTAGVPAPRSMTSAGVPTPTPRSMAAAGVAPSAPGRSRPSAGADTVCVPEAPARRALPMAPAGPVHRPPPVSPMQPSQGARTTPLPTSAQDPVWASKGPPPPRPRPASAVAVLSSSVRGAVHGTASPPPFRATPTPAGGGALPPRGASAFHSAPSSGPAASSPSTPPSSAPLVRLHAEVRRLGPNALAFRLTPQSRWVLFSSRSPIQVRRVDTLEEALRETRDFSLDITVEEPERLDVDSLP